jgi:HAD superfamily hydrolase (TIGR01493 family)
MPRAVIFDFSGTLFRCEEAGSWLRGALTAAGIHAPDPEISALTERLRIVGGQPGGPGGFTVPEHLKDLFARRDLSAADHRAAYLALIQRAALPWPGLDEVLYDRHSQPEAWQPYPDTPAALELLAGTGTPVVVLSNIGWDLRPVFTHHRLDHLISGYVLSYEAGTAKPDPRIFELACHMLGHEPADVLMIGDDTTADGAAARIGCAFRPVPHAPASVRPTALLDALAVS